MYEANIFRLRPIALAAAFAVFKEMLFISKLAQTENAIILKRKLFIATVLLFQL